MKNTLIRIFTIITLATSISAFAGSDKSAKDAKTKPNDTKCETTAAPSTADRKEGQSDNNEEKARKRLIEEQEKQWLHDVQNLTAG